MNLSTKFSTSNLLKFAASSMLMMFVLAAYTAIDGLFISQNVENGIGALNIVMPIINGTLALSFMFSTGTNSVISQLMGEKKQHQANSLLSSIYIIAAVVGLVITTVGLLFKIPILQGLGANDNLMPLANSYFSIIIFFIPFLFLQDFGQVYFITASKPGLSLLFTTLGGIANAVLDYVFIVKMHMGMSGAALATGIGYLFPALASIIYLSIQRKDNLCFNKPSFNWRLLLFSFYNGSSEFLSNISATVITILVNFTMLSIAGVDGVDAISVVLQMQFLMASIFIGYSIGVLPIIGYKFGANDYKELKSVVNKSLKIIATMSLLIVVFGLIFYKQIIGAYLPNQSHAYSLAISGFVIYVWTFLVMGFNFFVSMMFTGIGDAARSIIISLLRSFVFSGLFILTLPHLIGINGVWLSIVCSESLTFIISIFLYKKYFINRFKHDQDTQQHFV